MNLLKLYLLFFKLGVVNFGGGYAMLPLLERELVTKRGYITSDDLADYYAVGQCTPGTFAVNVSTFIGIKRKGVLGGIVATLGFVSPAFIIIFIIATLLTNFASNTYVMNALAGIRVAVFGLVLFAVSKLIKKSIKEWPQAIIAFVIAVMAITLSVIPLYCYIIAAGVLGIVINLIKEKKKNKTEIKPVESAVIKTEEPDSVKEEISETECDSEDREAPKKKKNVLQNVLWVTFGFVTGLCTGVIGLILGFVFKLNKYFKTACASAFMLFFVALAGIITWIATSRGIIFTVFFQFFKIGICAFGGGLATIPFLSELGETTGWFSQLDLANMIAVSESTPGAMGINMSTYVGYTVLSTQFDSVWMGFLGSIISTLGLVCPSVIVISIVAAILQKFKTNKYVEWVFYGLRAASIGLIIAALYSIVKVSLFKQYVSADTGDSLSSVSHAWTTAFQNVSWSNFTVCLGNFVNLLFDWRALAVGLVFVITIFKFKKHPILYIALSAVAGILLNMYQVTEI